MTTETKKTLAELKVAELKNELEKRGLDKNGVKVTLSERLEKALTAEGHDAKTYLFTISQDGLPSPSPKLAKKIAKPEETGAPPIELAQNRGDSTQNLTQKQGNESPTIVTSAAMFPEETIDEEQVEDQNPDEHKLVIVSDNDDLAQEIVENESEMIEVEECQDPEETMETDEVSQGLIEEAQKVPDTPEAQLSNPLPNENGAQQQPVSEELVVQMDTIASAKEEQADDEQIEIPNLENEPHKEESQKAQENVEHEELDYEPNEQTEQEKKAETVHEEAESEDQNVEDGSVATVVSSKPVTTEIGDKKDCSLWIRGLPNSIKAADLKAAFSKYGKVITSKIFTTKNKQAPTCFGYITMSDAASAKLCMQNLHRTNLKGRIINIEPAEKMFPSKTPAKIIKENKAEASTSSAVKQETSVKADVKKEATDSKNVTKTDRKPITHKPDSRSIAASRAARDRAIIRKEAFSRRREELRSRRPVLTSRRGLTTSSRSIVRRMITSRLVVTRRAERERLGGYRRELPSLMEYRPSSAYRPSGSSSLAYRVSRSARETRRARTPPRYASDRAVEKARVERDRMRDMMNRREEEHRKREEELRLERERERIRFEREKLEREKLELQQLKQLAALATQAPYVPIQTVPQPLMAIPSGGGSRDRERERATKKVEPSRRSGPTVSTSRRSRSPMIRHRSPSGTRGRGTTNRGRASSIRGRGGPTSAPRYSRPEPKRSEPSVAEKYAAYEREQTRQMYPDPRDVRPKSPPRYTSASYASRGSTGRGGSQRNDPRGGYDTRRIEPARGPERTHSRDTRDRHAYDSRTAPPAPSHYSTTSRSDPYASSRSSAYTSSREAPFSHPDPYSSATKAAPGYTDRYRNDSLPATYRDTQNYNASSSRGGNETWANRGSTWADAAAGGSSNYAGNSSSSPWASGRSDTWQQPNYGSSSSQNVPSRGYDPYALKSSSSSRRY
uniref:Uncharacterized protein n=1 Tax=Acrobeloides nanus TaxID=290746 RepID=A0A914BWP6_9BILA